MRAHKEQRFVKPDQQIDIGEARHAELRKELFRLLSVFPEIPL